MGQSPTKIHHILQWPEANPWREAKGLPPRSAKSPRSDSNAEERRNAEVLVAASRHPAQRAGRRIRSFGLLMLSARHVGESHRVVGCGAQPHQNKTPSYLAHNHVWREANAVVSAFGQVSAF